jgi:DNA-binding HxlR family transcriptional regulator
MSLASTREEATDARNAAACPVVQTLEAMGTPWRLHVLYALRDGELRFNQLKRATGGRSKTVSDVLDTLTDHGLVARRTEEAAPIAVYYRLTEKGASLVDELDGVSRGAVEWLDEVEDPDAMGSRPARSGP